MPKCQLAIVVKEQEYMRRLADFVSGSSYSEQWQIVAFSSADACVRYVQEGYRIDLVAGQPELLAGIRTRAEVAAIPRAALVMTFGQSDSEPELRQYQPLPDLLLQLSELHHRSRTNAVSASIVGKEEDKRLIAVYSTGGQEGKTALALHLVQAAGARGLRVFYLNLELWNSSESWLGSASDKQSQTSAGLSELLYKLKSDPKQAVGWLLEHRISHSLLKADYLAPSTNVEDRFTLGAEDTRALMEAVLLSGPYDLVVIDMEAELGEVEMSVFEKVHQVLWVVNESAAAEGKRQLKLAYGKQRWGERFDGLSHKFVHVLNRSTLARVAMDGDRRWLASCLPEVLEWRGLKQPLLLSSPGYRAAADKLFQCLFRDGGEKHC